MFRKVLCVADIDEYRFAKRTRSQNLNWFVSLYTRHLLNIHVNTTSSAGVVTTNHHLIFFFLVSLINFFQRHFHLRTFAFLHCQVTTFLNVRAGGCMLGMGGGQRRTKYCLSPCTQELRRTPVSRSTELHLAYNITDDQWTAKARLCSA